MLPSLVYGMGTWIRITNEEVFKLENMQLYYPSLVLQVRQGVTKVSLRSETGLECVKLNNEHT